LCHLPEILDRLDSLRQRFILFCDDLSFGPQDTGYPALKAALDGSLSGQSENVLIYATSNRRHLMPEFMAENLEARHLQGEIHPGETTEEKVSLSDRFGLWVSFHPIDQTQYLEIARHWSAVLGARDCDSRMFTNEALQWALSRGARSGRVAMQFARDWAGRGK
jgi:uncharacterized protein